MYVERVLSLNDGWSILTSHKIEEWEEALLALHEIDDDTINRTMQEVGTASVHVEYIYVYNYSFFKHFLDKQFGWTVEVPANILHKGPFTNITVKNKVLASQIGLNDLAGTAFSNQLYAIIPHAHYLDSIDVGVIFIPTNEAINHFIKLGAVLDNIEELPTEKFCRVEAARFIALTSRTPIVLAFFSPTAPNELAVEELSVPKVTTAAIERTIEFASEHYQAGVGLLSYFGEVLRQKDPNIKAKVRIEQDGNKVRLHIESPSGDIETIEEELEKYALVISNKAAPESLFENRAYVMQLEHKLDITKLELKQAYNTIALTDGLNSQRINNLEQQLDFLKEQVARQLTQTDKVIELAAQQTGSHERIQTALLTHSQTLFQDLLREASGNQRLAEAVTSLQHSLLSGMATIDIEDKLEQALATIKETKPGFLGRIHKELEGATYKAMASSTLTWVTNWLGTHAQ